jgi:hypothetical protein
MKNLDPGLKLVILSILLFCLLNLKRSYHKTNDDAQRSRSPQDDY